MFKIKPTEVNNKIFYLKDLYTAEETFNYDLRVYNHITKTGFTIALTDESPWTSGLTNSSTLITGATTDFYSGSTAYLNSYSNLTFIFNNIIQISGTNYQFTTSTGISYTKSCMLNGNYVIVFNDNGAGKIVIVNSAGTILTGATFISDNILDLDIIPISTNKVVLSYYLVSSGQSFLKEIAIVGTSLTMYNPTMYFNGRSSQIKINKVSDIQFILTYQTLTQGIIQKVKLSTDHIFSVGFPFVFNDDITLFCNSVLQDDNVVVLFYDLDDQLKVKNCRIYSDYIGVGLPVIVKDNYCYDLGIGKLDNSYVYISYYDGNDMLIYTSLLKIDDDDITIIDNAVPIPDWNEGMNLTTISSTKYMLSYMNSGYTGVYRYIDISGGTFVDIECDFNEFNIDISHLDYSKNLGHNDYWIYYNNVIVEKGVCYINSSYDFTYNV